MKKILISGIIVMLAIGTFAQDKKQEEVAQVVTTLRQAILDGDSAKLDQLTDSDLTYGHSLGKIENKKEFISALASGRSDFETLDIYDQTIIAKKKIAVVRHTITANIKENDKTNTVKLKVMMVFHKDDKNWKLLARQAIRL